MNLRQTAIVSAILFKRDKDQVKFFIQTRFKPKVSPSYSGMLEIPAGVIDAYESVYEAIVREVKEETNLDIIKLGDIFLKKFNLEAYSKKVKIIVCLK